MPHAGHDAGAAFGHPRIAWNWLILEGSRKTALGVIEAVLETRFDDAKMQTVTIQ
ncbi:hypothetical protein HB772_29500 (plasmid) [Sinorhizobium meliloti]|nr:hypothetical protein HB772_29500 [Sinorhizobium meliloti]